MCHFFRILITNTSDPTRTAIGKPCFHVGNILKRNAGESILRETYNDLQCSEDGWLIERPDMRLCHG